MKKIWLPTGIALCLLAAVGFGSSVFAADSSDPHVLDAVLRGQNEVPPTSSSGLGETSLLLSADGNTLYYAVEVSGASSTVTAAHIHMGRRGDNGDVVANLCGAGSAPACGTEGVIASGSITAASLVGPLAGHPLSELVSAMANGGAYSNVHTSNNPSGEMRGQVRSLEVFAGDSND